MNEAQIGSLHFLLDLSQPLYEQVLNQVRSSIAKGEVVLGDKMPSVRELALALKINPNTVMRAYQELDRDGLTETRRGQGTYITTDAQKVQSVRRHFAEQAVEEFLDRMRALGYDIKEISKLIEAKGGRPE